MKHKKLNMCTLIVVVILLVGLTGCDVPKIIYATPNPSKKITMKIGDKVDFAVKLNQHTSDEVKYRWLVENDGGYKQINPDNNDFKFSYTADLENGNRAISNHILVTFEVIQNIDGGCASTVQVLDSKQWELEIVQQPSVWNGNYSIQSNEDIARLHDFVQITGDLIIGTDEVVTNQEGLKNLVSIDGSLRVSFADRLTNLAGLCKLASVESIHIYHNPKLENIEALSNITTVPNNLSIWGNDVLASLQGLNNISTIGNNLEIRENAALVDLQGLDNLTSVGNWISIYDNEALTSFKGLENLASVNEISIMGNSSMCNDFAQQFCDQLYAAGVLATQTDIILNKMCYD